MKNSTASKVLCGAVFGIAAVLSTTVSADNYSETVVSTTAEGLRTVSVSYADLDLTSSKAQETLERRISQAARSVCGSPDWRAAGTMRQASENKSCYHDSLAAALNQTASQQFVVVAR